MDKDQNNTNMTELQPQPEAVSNTQLPHKPARQRRASPLLLIMVLLVAATLGLWFWQQSKIKNLNKKITTLEQQSLANDQALKQTSTQAQVKAKDQPASNASNSTNSDVSDNLLPSISEISDSRITIDVLAKYKDNIKAVWAEYGESPENLNKSTIKVTYELGLGPRDVTYSSGASFPINATELKLGTRYYFRGVGQYGEQVEKSGVSSFVTKK